MPMHWDDRLISAGTAMEIAGDHAVWVVPDDDGRGLQLRCGTCSQSCGLWALGRPTTASDFLSGVLRHLVTAHDQPLNNAARQHQREDGNDRTGTGDHPGSSPGPQAADGPGPGPGPGPGVPGAVPGAGRAGRPGTAARGRAGR